MDSTARFSNRVQDYIAYRPGYPEAILPFLGSAIGLGPSCVVADIGSGTGIWSKLLLQAGCRVYAVEPNAPMREAAEVLLAQFPLFHSIDGTAEATKLASASVDAITAAQAFHWFHPAKTRQEFGRILKPGGHLVLIWNDRRTDSTPFLRDYEVLLKELGTDYEQVNHRNIDEGRLSAIFGPSGYREQVFPNAQRFDWEGLYGRAMSSSYVPAEGDPRHPDFARALRACYERHALEGFVQFEYDTRVYYGRLD
ncbi:MAG: class I SAM-dependent methyltransferase [Candidatus Hydrogenedentes bacterium]|nr:class I SAM-dependent methyltransferase [Candidatus Hydrogenedentota bacterium]